MTKTLRISGPGTVEPYHVRNDIESALAAGLPSTHWAQVEDALASGLSVLVPRERYVTLPIPSHLHYRRCYMYREVVLDTATQYVLQMTMAFRRNGRVVAPIPINIQSNPNDVGALWAESCASLFSSNTASVGADCLELTLSRRMSESGTAGANNERSVLLTPARFVCPADEVSIDVQDVQVNAGSVSNLKIWIGILSSDRPL